MTDIRTRVLQICPKLLLRRTSTGTCGLSTAQHAAAHLTALQQCSSIYRYSTLIFCTQSPQNGHPQSTEQLFGYQHLIFLAPCGLCLDLRNPLLCQLLSLSTRRPSLGLDLPLRREDLACVLIPPTAVRQDYAGLLCQDPRILCTLDSVVQGLGLDVLLDTDKVDYALQLSLVGKVFRVWLLQSFPQLRPRIQGSRVVERRCANNSQQSSVCCRFHVGGCLSE